MERINNFKKAEITAFLSLILLLVLALIATLLESARVNTARVFADRALETSIDSVFTCYARELFDDYHVFFMKELESDTLTNQIKEYMDYTFFPNKDLNILDSNIKLPNVNLWGICTQDLEIMNKVYATDFHGNIFANEAINFMKYQSGSNQLKNLLDHLDIFDKTGKTSAVVEEKLKVEESLGELNQFILEIIKLTEGISTNKNGIRYASNGLLKTELNYIKQLCPQAICSNNLGINNSMVWNSLKDQYRNPIMMLNNIKTNITSINQCEKQLEQLEIQKNELNNLYNESDKKGKKKLKEALDVLEESINEIEQQIDKCIQLINNSKSELINISNAITPKISKVLGLIPLINEKQESMSAEVEQFESTLDKEKDNMVTDVYEGMQNDLNYMKQYVGKESSGLNESIIFRIQQMKPILESNQLILDQTNRLSKLGIISKKTDWFVLSECIQTLSDYFNTYQVKPLCFDYSSLKAKSDTPNPIHSLNKLISDGVLDLVLENKDNISKKKISNPDCLYTQNKEDDTVSEVQEQNVEKMFSRAENDGYQSDMTHNFHNYSEDSKSFNTKDQKDTELENILLWNEYEDYHYRDFTSNNEEWIKQSSLDYEKEYILHAKETDDDNLRSVINQLLGIRTIFNFIYLISDGQCRDKAYATAAALVGYTCLEPLVRLTQILLLMTWAFVESLIDVGAFLSGKKIPILKDRKSFVISFNELLQINKQFIQSKIKNLPESRNGYICLGYQEYIRIFLLMTNKEKQVYRSMDIIQENLSLRSGCNFKLDKCLFGIRVSCKWNLPVKFAKLGFVSNVLQHNKEGWQIHSIKNYSY